MRVSSIQVAPSATRISDDEEPCEVGHLGGEEQEQPDDREHDVCPDAVAERGCEPAARGQCPTARACEPGRDEEEDPDDDHQAERTAHEVGEDVPRVVGRLAVVAAAPRASRRRSCASALRRRGRRGRRRRASRRSRVRHGGGRGRARPRARKRRASGSAATRPASSGARNAFWAVSSSSARRITMRPASAGILSATCSPMPIRSAASWMIVLRSSVTHRPRCDTRFPPPSSTWTSVLCVSSSVVLEELLEPRLLERSIDDLIRGLPQSGGRCAGQALVVLRELGLDLGLDVDVREELVDGAVGDGASGSSGRRGASCSCPRRPLVFSATRLIQTANEEEQEQQAGDDEDDPDGSRAAAALSAARLGAGGAFGLACSSRRSEATRRRARTPRAEPGRPAGRPHEGSGT